MPVCVRIMFLCMCVRTYVCMYVWMNADIPPGTVSLYGHQVHAQLTESWQPWRLKAYFSVAALWKAGRIGSRFPVGCPRNASRQREMGSIGNGLAVYDNFSKSTQRAVPRDTHVDEGTALSQILRRLSTTHACKNIKTKQKHRRLRQLGYLRCTLTTSTHRQH